MSVYLQDSMVLLDSDLVATDEMCCCTPMGACCVDTTCSITTEADCADMGGIYQGDDTTCDPNPCEPTPSPCCDAFGFAGYIDGSTRFLTKTNNYTYDDSDGPPGLDCHTHYSHTTVHSIDPTTCETTITCFGGGTRTGALGDFTWTWEFIAITGDCGCVGGPCGPCNVGPCSSVVATTVISNTELQDTCHDSVSGFTADATVTETLSNPCIQT